MGSETLDADGREVLVNLAIYDYHVAIERGERPDPAAWVARHAEIAPELNAYFEDLAAFDLVRPPAPSLPGDTTVSFAGQDPEARTCRTPTADFRPGDVLGDYVLLEKLGEGGQGVVWKASPQHSRDIVVALKTLPGPAVNDAASIHRLGEDARAIARMKHANIVRTSYFGEDRGCWFFVMELLEGGTVADRLESTKADPRAAAALMEKVARAIHHAHTRNPGVLHLDLKPSNILLTADGEPKVTDFGLSMRCKTFDPPGQAENSESTGHLDAGEFAIVGTIPFMSNEMADGRWWDVSTASDVYGLGAVLYAMLAGQAPFLGRDLRETLALVVGGEPKSPCALNRKVDRELGAVCLKCLHREPRQRYGSADALANDLHRWLERRPTLAGGRPSVTRELRFWVRRHPFRLALASVAVVGLWLASLAVSMANLRAENGREAERLASQVDRELRLIRRATQILATDPRLLAAFASTLGPGRAGQRRDAIEAFLTTAVEGENLFGIAGGNPFVNVFVLDPDGVLLADTLPLSPAIGKNYHVRDYYRAFHESDWPRDHVYVARSFLSVKDNRYKIAVAVRIWGNGDTLDGILVANFTIGPRLIDVDMRQERSDAAVLCPMDQSNPLAGNEDRVQPPHYISVLDRRYTVDWQDRPFLVDASRLPAIPSGRAGGHATGGAGAGKLVDYHRVGQTHMVVVMKRNGPWPLSWLPEFR